MKHLLLVMCISAILMGAGLQTSTQWSASLISAQERGPAWFSVAGYAFYAPYQGLLWFVDASDALLAVLFPPTAVGFGSVLIGIVVLRLARGSRRRTPDIRISGARWATRQDLRKGGLL